MMVIKCLRCGRKLTDPRSIAAGVGRTCRARIAAAATVATGTDDQIEKARQLVDDGGLVRIGAAVFRAMSSDGTATYEVQPAAGRCTCTAGQHGHRCYHLISAEIMSGLAAPTAAPAIRPVQLDNPNQTDPFRAFYPAAA